MSDFFSGGCVGLAQVAVGHPFDTAKVLIQNKTPLSGLSISNFYRGWRFPLFRQVYLIVLSFLSMKEHINILIIVSFLEQLLVSL